MAKKDDELFDEDKLKEKPEEEPEEEKEEEPEEEKEEAPEEEPKEKDEEEDFDFGKEDRGGGSGGSIIDNKLLVAAIGGFIVLTIGLTYLFVWVF